MRDRIDPLLILGDSMVYHLARQFDEEGIDFAEHLSRDVSFPVPHRAENGGANFAPRRYAERYIHEENQPQVVLLVAVMDQLLREWSVIKFPSAKRSGLEASSEYIATDETTLGDWKGRYGSDGYFIVGDDSKFPPSLTVEGGGQVFPTINAPGSLNFETEDSNFHSDRVNLRIKKDEERYNRGLLKASTDSGERSTSTTASAGASPAEPMSAKFTADGVVAFTFTLPDPKPIQRRAHYHRFSNSRPASRQSNKRSLRSRMGYSKP